jgi:hypothetical protein
MLENPNTDGYSIGGVGKASAKLMDMYDICNHFLTNGGAITKHCFEAQKQKTMSKRSLTHAAKLAIYGR